MSELDVVFGLENVRIRCCIWVKCFFQRAAQLICTQPYGVLHAQLSGRALASTAIGAHDYMEPCGRVRILHSAPYEVPKLDATRS